MLSREAGKNIVLTGSRSRRITKYPPVGNEFGHSAAEPIRHAVADNGRGLESGSPDGSGRRQKQIVEDASIANLTVEAQRITTQLTHFAEARTVSSGI